MSGKQMFASNSAENNIVSYKILVPKFQERLSTRDNYLFCPSWKWALVKIAEGNFIILEIGKGGFFFSKVIIYSTLSLMRKERRVHKRSESKTGTAHSFNSRPRWFSGVSRSPGISADKESAIGSCHFIFSQFAKWLKSKLFSRRLGTHRNSGEREYFVFKCQQVKVSSSYILFYFVARISLLVHCCLIIVLIPRSTNFFLAANVID